MHLHLGFDATGLDDLQLHHIVVNSWEGGVDTEQASPSVKPNLNFSIQFCHLSQHSDPVACRLLSNATSEICH